MERPTPVEDAAACGPLRHGETVAPHVHGFGQLRYAARGVLVTSTPAGTWLAPADRLTWIPAGVVHRSRAHGETDVRIAAVGAAQQEFLPPEPAVLVVSPLAREAFLAVTEPGAAQDAARHRLLLEVVTTELVRAPQDGLRLPEPHDSRLRAVTDLLHADPGDDRTLAQWGRRTGSSERTLSRLFAADLSMSFHQWRALLRVQWAMVDLADGASVTDTAMRLGWANPSSFIDTFSGLVGQTPGRYRAAARGSGAVA